LIIWQRGKGRPLWDSRRIRLQKPFVYPKMPKYQTN
jgi:hypothetical protein